jgi:hypothetical protein
MGPNYVGSRRILYMAYGYNRYAAFNHNILHVKILKCRRWIKCSNGKILILAPVW